MLAIDSSRARTVIAAGWLCFAIPNATLMFLLPGEETIPYHLIWASFGFLYGLTQWPVRMTWLTFAAITVVTAIPLLQHARAGYIGFEECSEIPLMGLLAALLVWHVDRHAVARSRLADMRDRERVRAHNRELATRFGSHELRTRLTIARGFAEIIRDGAVDDRTRSDADTVLAELDKASVLTTNLMTFVRVDAQVVIGEVDLDELIDTVVRRWVGRVDRRWRVRTAAGPVVGDAERIEAALDCLIENAVKFTMPGDSVSVEARTKHKDVVLSVEDSGSGIPADDLQHVTELFHTGSTAGERAGSGLGLSIVRAIAEGRGGTVEISSVLRAGTRVTVRMPRGVILDGDRGHGGGVADGPVDRSTLQSVRPPTVPAGVES